MEYRRASIYAEGCYRARRRSRADLVADFNQPQKGLVKALFQKGFEIMREKGQIVSHLYPFQADYYRQYGYEVCCKHRRWRIPIEYIRNDDLGQHVYYDGSEKMQQEIREIYRVFSKQYNLSVVKSEKCWERFFQSVLPYAGEHTIVSRGGEPDIILNINAFSAMILGAVDLEDALIFPGVRIMGRTEELEKVFYRKHQFIDVHF